MLQFFKELARFMVHHILKMTKEGFHRGIIPAVSPTGHGLAETQLFDSVLELGVGIMDALIGIYHCLRSLRMKQFYGFIQLFEDAIDDIHL